jgi:hypothetical protein
MQYDYSNLLWCIPGILIAVYGVAGIVRRNITTYGRGGRRGTWKGKAAVVHGVGVVLFGLAFIGFGLLGLVESAHS